MDLRLCAPGQLAEAMGYLDSLFDPAISLPFYTVWLKYFFISISVYRNRGANILTREAGRICGCFSRCNLLDIVIRLYEQP